MRGKALCRVHAPETNGITPAYAGKSRTLYAEAKNYEDHPRLCGEKFTNPPLAFAGQGSPPPMRGKVERRH